MKAAIYARVSTEDQSNDRQVEICEQYCEFNKFPVYRIYQDVYTGVSDSRPALNDLLRDMRAYKINLIVITKLDRLGRSLQHLISMIEEFAKKGVNFVAVTQNIDTHTASGKLQLHILGAFAEFERNLISERTKEALKNKINVGKRGKDKKPRKTDGYKDRYRGGPKK